MRKITKTKIWTGGYMFRSPGGQGVLFDQFDGDIALIYKMGSETYKETYTNVRLALRAVRSICHLGDLVIYVDSFRKNVGGAQ